MHSAGVKNRFEHLSISSVLQNGILWEQLAVQAQDARKVAPTSFTEHASSVSRVESAPAEPTLSRHCAGGKSIASSIMAGTDDFQGIADRLDSIAEELDDLITDQLRMAVSSAAESGQPDPAILAEEKKIARARRSVAKAAAILRPPPID